MKFPIKADRIDSSSNIYPGWCTFHISSNFCIVAPCGGFFYLIRAVPTGLSNVNEIMMAFIPHDSQLLHNHPAWKAPLWNLIVFRLNINTIQSNVEQFIQGLLKNCYSNGLTSWQSLQVTIGQEAVAVSQPDAVEYLLASFEQRQAVVTILRDAWFGANPQYPVIRVTENLQLFPVLPDSDSTTSDPLPTISSGEVSIAFLNTSGHNPFGSHAYWFDTETYLKRFQSYNWFSNSPRFVTGWNYADLVNSFYSGERGEPFKINFIFPNSIQTAPVVDVIEITGGLQHVKIVFPYRSDNIIIFERIFQVFNDVYGIDEPYSGNHGNQNASLFQINAHTHRVLSINGSLPIEFSTSVEIRKNHLNQSIFPRSFNFNIGEMRFTTYTTSDPFVETESLIGEIISLKGAALDLLEREAPNGIKYRKLVLLKSTLQNLNITTSRGYMIDYNSEKDQIERSILQKIRRLKEICIESGGFQYYLHAFPQKENSNVKRWDLWYCAYECIEDYPVRSDETRGNFNNLFSESPSIDGGLNREQFFKAWKATGTIPSSIAKVVTAAIKIDINSRLSDMLARINRGPIIGYSIITNRSIQYYHPLLERTGASLTIEYVQREGMSVPEATINPPQRLQNLASAFDIIGKSLNLYFSIVEFYNLDVEHRSAVKFAKIINDAATLMASSMSTAYKNISISTLTRYPSLISRTALLNKVSVFLGFTSAVITTLKVISTINGDIRISSNVAARNWLYASVYASWGEAFGGAALTLGYLSPPVAATIIIASILYTIIFQIEYSNAMNPILIYLPQPLAFRLACYLQRGLYQDEEINRIFGTGSTTAFNNYIILNHEWVHNIDIQISIALSYICPITIGRIQFERRNEQITLEFQFKSFSPKIFILLKIDSIDDHPVRFYDLLSFEFTQESPIINNLRLLDGRAVLGATSSNGHLIHVRIRWRPEDNRFNLATINKITIVTSLQNVADTISATDFYIFPFTSRIDAQVIVPDSEI